MGHRHMIAGLESLIRVFGWAFVGIISFILGAMVAARVPHITGLLGLPPIVATEPFGQLLLGVVMYGVMIGLIALVMRFRHASLSWHDTGLNRLLEWRDMLLALPAVVLYIALSALGIFLASKIPGFDATQVQETGLGEVYGINRSIAFLSLVVFAPVMEEIIFRGVVYGKMRQTKLSWWIPALVVSTLFGAAHMQWNVAVDVFCLSLVLCGLREVTGSIWAGILVHMLKNLVAFSVLFHVFGV